MTTYITLDRKNPELESWKAWLTDHEIDINKVRLGQDIAINHDANTVTLDLLVFDPETKHPIYDRAIEDFIREQITVQIRKPLPKS